MVKNTPFRKEAVQSFDIAKHSKKQCTPLKLAALIASYASCPEVLRRQI